ncbi:NACHT domain-containing protein [Pseudanabaena biceps]|nr:NACHT domain-containing protein [Pseudanabaena biceps]
MDIKQEQIVHRFVKRFEAALLGFTESIAARGIEIEPVYFGHTVARSARHYARNYAKVHGLLQIFGDRRLSTLNSIYIPQKFQTHTSIRNFESVDELEEAFSYDLQRGNRSKGNNLLGLNVANEEAYLTILGQPATGKTTFLKYIGLEALQYPESRYKHDLIPVFIPMWKFSHSGDQLLEAIAEEFEKSKFPHSQELAIWLLERGKLLVLIDGLNEAGSSQQQLSKHFREFVKTYSKNRYIVSSRLVCYQNSLGQFLELAMQPWSDLLIQEYIHKWFAIAYEAKDVETDVSTGLDVASEEAQRCWQIVQLNPIARDLANSPLCLSLLCLLCDRHYSFPSHVSGLYEKAIHLVLEEQVLKCQALTHEGRNILSTDILEIFLTEIAYKSFEMRRTTIPLSEVSDHLQIVLTNCKGSLQNLDIDFAIKVLQQMGICKIITSESTSGTGLAICPNFTFSHITLQEYFTARYIYQHQKIGQVVTNHLNDRHWQEVFLLVSGMMMGNAEELLLEIEAQAITYINTSKLQDILDWLDQVTFNSQGEYKNVIKRIATLFLARPRFLVELSSALRLTRVLGTARDLYQLFDNSLDFDPIFAADLSMSLAHALDFDSTTELNLAIQLCSQLEQVLNPVKFDQKYINFAVLNSRLQALVSQTPSYDQSFEIREEFRNQIGRIWLQTLYLPAELNQISLQEIEALDSYLYANLLMIKCKNMAISVSLKKWQKIESQMLKIIK